MARSNDLTDEEILSRANLVYSFKSAKKFCAASRRFRSCTRQWPWDWCGDDLNPQHWGAALVTDLARLAETYACHGKNIKEAREPLRRMMRARKDKNTDIKGLFLDHRDVNKVINDFRLQHTQQNSSSSSSTEPVEERKPSTITNNTVNKPATTTEATITPELTIETTASVPTPPTITRDLVAPMANSALTAPVETGDSVAEESSRASTVEIQAPVEPNFFPDTEPTLAEESMPQKDAVPQTIPSTTPEAEPESEPALETTTITPEVYSTAYTPPDTQELFPVSPESRDSKAAVFWDEMYKPKNPVTTNKKRSSCSSQLPSSKRSRKTEAGRKELEKQAAHRPLERVFDTLATMQNHSDELQAQFSIISRRLDDLLATDPSKVVSHSERHGSGKLPDKMWCLRQSIQELETEGEQIRERAKSWEKVKNASGVTDASRACFSKNIDRQLKENEEAIVAAERTLRKTSDAIVQERIASVQEHYNKTLKELLDWDTMMKFVEGFPSSLETVNMELKKQETSLVALLYGKHAPPQKTLDEVGNLDIDDPIRKALDIRYPATSDYESTYLDGI